MTLKQKLRFTFKEGPRETICLQSKKKSQGNKGIYLQLVLSLSFRNLARVKCENSILNVYYLSGGSEHLTGKCRRAFSGYVSRQMGY